MTSRVPSACPGGRGGVIQDVNSSQLRYYGSLEQGLLKKILFQEDITSDVQIYPNIYSWKYINGITNLDTNKDDHGP